MKAFKNYSIYTGSSAVSLFLTPVIFALAMGLIFFIMIDAGNFAIEKRSMQTSIYAVLYLISSFNRDADLKKLGKTDCYLMSVKNGLEVYKSVFYLKNLLNLSLILITNIALYLTAYLKGGPEGLNLYAFIADTSAGLLCYTFALLFQRKKESRANSLIMILLTFIIVGTLIFLAYFWPFMCSFLYPLALIPLFIIARKRWLKIMQEAYKGSQASYDGGKIMYAGSLKSEGGENESKNL